MWRTDANVRKNAINCEKNSQWAFQNANTCAKIFYPSLIPTLAAWVGLREETVNSPLMDFEF